MRILFLCSTPPLSPTSGAVIQTFHFMRLLGERHEVGLWTILNDGPVETELGPLGSVLEFHRFVPIPHSWALNRRWAWLCGGNPMARWGYHGKVLEDSLIAAVREFKPDIVQCEQLYAAHFFLRLSKLPNPPLMVFNAHDAMYVVLERSLAAKRHQYAVPRYWLESWFLSLVRRMEQRVVRSVDLVCCVSDTDAATLRLPQEAKRFAVTPNGVDIDYFSFLPEVSDARPPVLVFTGSMNYGPNADAIEYYLQSMHGPLRSEFPGLELIVVGTVTGQLRSYEGAPGLRFVGFQNDIRPFFQEATLSIVPLRAGSGTRFKILESWALGRAVVSTTIGAEGLPYRDAENILIADSPSEFCKKVALLLRDGAIRKRLALAGRKVVEQGFSWNKIVADLDQQLTKLNEERAVR